MKRLRLHLHGARPSLAALLGTSILLGASCAKDLDGPTPAVSGIEPSLVCPEQLTTEITLTGERLSPLAIDAATDDPLLAIPDIELRRVEDLDGASVTDDYVRIPNDPADPSAARVRWMSNTSMAFEVYPELGLEPGAYEIRVTNRNGNEAVFTMALAVVPSPTVESVEPDLICNEQEDQTLTITGSDFVAIRDAGGDLLPTVSIGDEDFTPESATDCVPIPATTLDAERCNTLTVVVPTTVTLEGEQAVVVTNPEPANCSSDGSTDVFFVAAPVLESVDPTGYCVDEQPESLLVSGSGFLRVDDGVGGFVDPTITLDSTPVAVTFAAADCTPFTSSVTDGEVCTAFTLPLSSPLAEGTHTVSIVNPAPADCTDSIDFEVVGTPEITDVEPPKVCADGDEFTVTGTGFTEDSEILLDDTPVPTTYGSDTQLTGTIESGFAPGEYAVTVSNGTDCVSDPFAATITVVAAPVVFYVDPPNVYNGRNMRITVWVTGVSGAAPEVGIRATGTADPLTMLQNPAYNGSNRVQADVLTTMNIPAGDYDVVVLDDPCTSGLEDALHVTGTLSVHVSGIDPMFATEGEDTGVTIFSNDPTPVGFDNFEKTPRVYFNPVAGGTATELRSVQWLNDPHKIIGVVPGVLQDGQYEVLVINPDGGVGLLSPDVFEVLDVLDPPPIVDYLDPGQVVATDNQGVIIHGANFPTDLADVDVSATCIDPRAPDSSLTVTDLTTSGGEVTVDSTSADAIETTWDMSVCEGECFDVELNPIPCSCDGYVCVVRVTNLANGSFVDYSALSATTAAGNLNPFFDSGRPLLEGRRALASASMRMNSQLRYLFAIGGDLGDDGISPVVRHSTVEAVPLDPFGLIIDDWSYQRNSLPEPRAFMAATTAGRFVYMAGGRVGAAPGTVDNAVLRAYLLDPDEAPVIDDLDLAQEAAGLAPGIWYYRVSAVLADGTYAPADPNNPGGEALASEPLVIQLPDLSPNLVHLTLRWDHVPNAVEYRIYRTKAPGGIAGDEVLLAEMPALTDLGNIVDDGGTPLARQSFLDDGVDNSAVDALDPANLPLPDGSLGVWHEVGLLSTEREGAAIVAVPDPADSSRYYLYVAGGLDADGNVVTTIERTSIVAATTSSQVLDPGGFVEQTTSMTGRWLIGAVYMDDRRSTLIGASTGNENEVWLYVLPGDDPNAGGGGDIGEVSAFLVDVADGVSDGVGVDGDGSLSAENDALDAPGPKYAGYGYVADHNYIHLLGAQTGGPSQSGNETPLDPAGPPLLDGWNAGTNLLEPRFLHGVAYQSAFVFLLGGETTVPASNTVEQTNF